MNSDVYNDLAQRIRREIELIDAQIAKSRTARGAPPLGSELTIAEEKRNNCESMPSANEQAAPTPVHPIAVHQIPAATHVKRGSLLNLGRPGRLLPSFKLNFIEVSDGGIAWWDAEQEFSNQRPPKDNVPFFEVTSNSRASKFKKAMTCWPLILKEDCSKATDPAIWYFGVEYFSLKTQKTELLCFGARSEEERNEWIRAITCHVKLFLANREESLQFVNFAVGSSNPPHCSCVLDGEAPR